MCNKFRSIRLPSGVPGLQFTARTCGKLSERETKPFCSWQRKCLFCILLRVFHHAFPACMRPLCEERRGLLLMPAEVRSGHCGGGWEVGAPFAHRRVRVRGGGRGWGHSHASGKQSGPNWRPRLVWSHMSPLNRRRQRIPPPSAYQRPSPHHAGVTAELRPAVAARRLSAGRGQVSALKTLSVVQSV